MIQPDNVQDVLNTDIRTPIPDAIVSKIISQPPFVNVPGVSNIRDLSLDNNLRQGFVYRSGNVADILDAGKAVLVDELKVTTIFDLRNQGERERVPSPEIEGIETVWLPYGARPASLNLKDFAGEDQGDTGFVKMYTGILEAASPAFTEIFKHIRDKPNDPFLVHCSAGKDRTGVLSALILLLIDRPHEEIIRDYMLTRAALEHVRENLTQALALHFGTDHLSPEAVGMLELSGVRAHAMAAFLKTFESTYGGVEGYLTKALFFSPEDIGKMRHNLMAEQKLN
ncbi:hypothetical protein N7448_005024 [Penicillium atrosanguineum]|uniref:Uncharacterized protein n=1 Tax=Penicillium atrosanguineum TaxID=1132637 RepID=A0A9W9L3L7_9EURO|nr:Ubiquitin-like protein ATG12 [Penicillium atrosanguineum]KAJ5125706.1 hypothetical protein N7526_007883 [Penicillium atrosanguineum]KAJ5136470.1 hypothetical protein N7448_005024 [Penicillium atrosanguineum]KAJ5292800.1 Ubiquitin-like protein ATG12 [Penicillium atrosanguineum]KAJ5303160.1 hypothetical protein N7476_009959 [Penicillium atrosanguineum]